MVFMVGVDRLSIRFFLLPAAVRMTMTEDQKKIFNGFMEVNGN